MVTSCRVLDDLREWVIKITIFLNMTAYSLAGRDIPHELNAPFCYTLKTETDVSSETLLDVDQNTRRHILRFSDLSTNTME